MSLEARLRRAEVDYQRSNRKADEKRRERNALVAEALAKGWSHGRIAAVTGLTRGRIGQMAKR